MSRTPSQRRFGAAIGLLLLAVALAALPGVVAADSVGDAESAGEVVVGENETVTGDLTSHTGTVIVDGTVEGDVTAYAGSVVVTGEVTGDVTSTAGSVTVSGTVGDDVESRAGSVDVQAGALVRDDMEASAGSISVADGATVNGDVDAAAGDLSIDGTVGGDAKTTETLRLGPGATVRGDATYGEELDRAADATVAGTVSQDQGHAVPSLDLGLPVVPSVLAGAYWTAVALFVGAVLLVVLPAFSDEVAATALADPLRAGGAGLLALVGVPAILLALLLSVVGIPVAFGGGFAFAIGAWLSLIYGEYVVGRWFLDQVDEESRWAALALGVVGVELLGRLPGVGGALKIGVLLLGLGAVALTVADRFTDGDGGDGREDVGDPVPDPGSAV